ncbi:uncharacterized protein METZ01_LOCUS214101 [marine metagenome]|uniref:dihydroorotate dehydrogenase (quinone) n=1 Tax=marine metagenome TaxID=408172 RepID=A0A382FGJ5_9ZZZZ
MEFYKHIIRPLLFKLPPETGHTFTTTAFRNASIWKLWNTINRITDERLKLSIAGISLDNPIGLAAGFDKNCLFLSGIRSLGFGYIVGGTVTLNPRPGNKHPRLFRNTKDKALVNALGFPNVGAKEVARNIQRNPSNPAIISISGLTVGEFVECAKLIDPLVEGLELNISSPNTVGLRIFHKIESFRDLIQNINQTRTKPLFIKLPPYYDSESQQLCFQIIKTSLDEGIDGFSVANTIPVKDKRLGVGSGGVSGKPLFETMVRMVQEIRQEIGQKLVINGCGGIFTSDDAIRTFLAGADTVQLYTGLIYEGPSIISKINQGLLDYLNEQGLEKISLVKG